MYKITVRWLTGTNKGINSIQKSLEKPRVGSVHIGQWGWKYKVLKIEKN